MLIRFKNINAGGFLLVIIILILSGCATFKQMALTEPIDVSKESVIIMNVKAANQYHPSYQPRITYANIWTNGDNPQKYSFFSDPFKPYKQIDGQYNEYLISASLPPGQYTLRELTGTSGIFPVIGQFTVPIYLDFEVIPNKIIYLGHISATNRERKNNELRAGSVVPLIDQAVTGFSGGTFDVEISDNYEEDVSYFKKEYPLIEKYSVDKKILPPWRRISDGEIK